MHCPMHTVTISRTTAQTKPDRNCAVQGGKVSFQKSSPVGKGSGELKLLLSNCISY